MIRPGLLILVASLLAGCGNLREIGVEPALSPVGAGLAGAPATPVEYAGYPAPPQKRFSLWNDRQSRLFTDPRALSPGDILTVRINISDRARFKNESDRPARMLISVAPAGLEGMFFEVGVPLAEGATTAPPPTKDEIEKLLAVAPSYGIEILLPGH